MVRALIAAIGEQHVRTNAAVTAIRPSASARDSVENEPRHDEGLSPASPTDRITVETAQGETFGGRALVLATPAYATGALLRDWDSELARLCNEVPYASSATVALAFRRDAVSHPLNGSGFVVPRVERSGILAASWLSSKWPHRAPDDRVLLRAFVGGAREPTALEKTDPEMVDVVMRALRPLLGITGAPLLTRVYRWERANAQHEVGHLDRLARIEDALKQRPGLFLTGSGYRGVGIPDCVADGRATARQVAERMKQCPASI
jgi:oxygen-dependent protoporphyrinogen oxidase